MEKNQMLTRNQIRKVIVGVGVGLLVLVSLFFVGLRYIPLGYSIRYPYVDRLIGTLRPIFWLVPDQWWPYPRYLVRGNQQYFYAEVVGIEIDQDTVNVTGHDPGLVLKTKPWFGGQAKVAVGPGMDYAEYMYLMDYQTPGRAKKSQINPDTIAEPGLFGWYPLVQWTKYRSENFLTHSIIRVTLASNQPTDGIIRPLKVELMGFHRDLFRNNN